MNALVSRTRERTTTIGRAVAHGTLSYLRMVWCCLRAAALVPVSVIAFVVEVVVLACTLLVVGVALLPHATRMLHAVARAGRSQASDRLGVLVNAVPPIPRERTAAGRSQEIITASSTWRELMWTLVQVPLGLACLSVSVIPGLNALISLLAAKAGAALLGYGDARADDDVESRGTASAIGNGGHGLIGMRERAEVLGGTLTVGRTPYGGFEVHVSFPLVGEGTHGAVEQHGAVDQHGAVEQ